MSILMFKPPSNMDKFRKFVDVQKKAVVATFDYFRENNFTDDENATSSSLVFFIFEKLTSNFSLCIQE